MALTEAQKEERSKSLERLKITTFKEEGNPGYIFISYKSDNWKEVFEGTVLKLQDKYSLRVYSDKQFEDSNRNWLDNMDKNIKYSSAVMVFISKEYLMSYATFIELLAAINYEREIIPVKLGDKDYFKELKSNRGLEDQTVEMSVTERAKLIEYIQSSDNYKFKNAIDQIIHRCLKKIEDKTFTMMSLVEAFENILIKSGQLQYNDSSTGLASLFNTILDACKGDNLPIPEAGSACSDETIGNNENTYKNSGRETSAEQAAPPSTEDSPRESSAEDRSGVVSSTGQWRYTTKKGADAWLVWNGEQGSPCTVKKGSRAAKEAPGFAKLSAANVKGELKKEGYIVDDCFVKDCEWSSISAMINVLCGGSVSMPDEKKHGRLREVSESELIGFAGSEAAPPSTEDSPHEPSAEDSPRESSADRSGVVSSTGQWRYTTKKGADAWLVWNGEQGSPCTVKKGSRAAKEALGFAKLSAAKLKDKLKEKGYIVDDCFVKDCECGSISAMINVLCGGSVSMPDEKKHGRLRVVSESDSLPGTEDSKPSDVQSTSGSGNKEGIGSLIGA